MSDLITPSMINAGKEHWFNSFDSMEREISAKLFVRACQKAGGWTVTKAQLDAEDSRGSYLFNGLCDGTWITKNADGTFTATHQFIHYVYGMFPAE